MADNYEKIKLIGNGSYGKVYLATNIKSNTSQRYVIKEIILSGLTAEQKTKTLNEVEILGICKHRNIVRYREAFLLDMTLSIVMEYVPGGDLNEKIKSRNGVHFEEKVILSWFVQICYALLHIHELHIMHRDLKSHNILLSSDERYVKIADFGISKTLADSDQFATTSIGTPYYMSPEQCLQKPYNFKCDLWSAGCVLYEICELKLPFISNDFRSLIIAITSLNHAPLSVKYSALLNDLIAVLLYKDPDKRPSAKQILVIPRLQRTIKEYTRMCLKDVNNSQSARSKRTNDTNRNQSNKRSQSLDCKNARKESRSSYGGNKLFRRIVTKNFEIRKSSSDSDLTYRNSVAKHPFKLHVSSSSNQSKHRRIVSDDYDNIAPDDAVFINENDYKDNNTNLFNNGRTYRITSQDKNIDVNKVLVDLLPTRGQSFSEYRRFYRCQLTRIIGASLLQKCEDNVRDKKTLPRQDLYLLPLISQLITLYNLC